MSLGKKLTISIISLLILANIASTARADEATTGINVSGGENHTLVLTADGAVWGCGWNLYYQLGIGDNTNQHTLVRVHGPEDVNYLEDINDIDAGWYHSLTLDLNGFVWAWARRTIPPRFSKFFVRNRIFLHLRAPSFVFIVEGRMYATAPTLPHPRHSARLEVDNLSSYKGLR